MQNGTRLARIAAATLIAAPGFLFGTPVRAQQVDAHVSYAPGDEGTHYPFVGAGVGARMIFDGRAVFVGTRLGIDYAREEHLGPGRGTIGLDLTLMPHRDMPAVLPYAGVGLSTSWSGGQQQQWRGFRTGLDGIVGADVAVFGTNFLGLKLEQRYGKIAQLPATFSTRVGLIAGF